MSMEAAKMEWCNIAQHDEHQSSRNVATRLVKLIPSNEIRNLQAHILSLEHITSHFTEYQYDIFFPRKGVSMQY